MTQLRSYLASDVADLMACAACSLFAFEKLDSHELHRQAVVSLTTDQCSMQDRLEETSHPAKWLAIVFEWAPSVFSSFWEPFGLK